MIALRRFLACLLVASSWAGPVASADEPVGLVLAGGGARGIAHVGAIAALEELRVPVHAIAGTSMGALVGGLYAAGMGADELYRVVQQMDWEQAFQDSVDRDDLPPRRKSDHYDSPPNAFSMAFKDGQFSIPLGLVQGQQVRQIIKNLVEQTEGIRDFDELPIPYRAVATDIESGEAYVFSHGDLVTAMRASMSLPALLAPVEHEGRLLVDGGLAMNIPVSVGRNMGGERLVVVDIGTPLRTREEITSFLGVTDQMLGFLTRRNSIEQLALMAADDILVSPDLTGIGMLDFERADEIFQRGYAATMAMREQLAPLALSPDDWSDYLARRTPQRVGEPVIDHIAIVNDSPLRDDLIRARITQQVGEPLDRARLGDDLASIYALDHWQLIDYEVVQDPALGEVLQVNAQAKTWGADRFRVKFNLLTDLDGSSEINLGASYLWPGLTDLGGELFARGQVGDTILFSGEYYQPLDVHSRFFVAPYLNYRDYDVTTVGPEFGLDDPGGNWRVRRLIAQFDTGVNLFDSAQVRLGLFNNNGKYSADRELGGNLPEGYFEEGGIVLSALYDEMDNPFLPTRGLLAYTDYRAMLESFGSDADFERWQAFAQAAFSFGREQRNTLILTGKTGQSLDAPNEPQNYFQLGGLFNLSGLSQDILSGRQMAFAMAQYQRRLSDTSVLPFDMPVYLGASIEGGQLWSDRSDISSGDFINAGSVYLVVDSPLGPIYLAYGRSEDNQDGIYLAMGWPFLRNQMRMGR